MQLKSGDRLASALVPAHQRTREHRNHPLTVVPASLRADIRDLVRAHLSDLSLIHIWMVVLHRAGVFAHLFAADPVGALYLVVVADP